MYDKFYFYLTEEFVKARSRSREELVDTWKSIARKGEAATFEDVREGTGAVTWKTLEVILVGWGVNHRNNLELVSAGGFVIEILDKTSS